MSASAKARNAKKAAANAAKKGSPIMVLGQNLDICPVCENNVKDDDNGIECNVCSQWWHAPCCNIDDRQYEWLKNGDSEYDIKFTCKNCKGEDTLDTGEVVSNAMIYKQMQQMMKTMGQMLKKYDKVNDSNVKLAERVDKLENEKCSAQPLNEIKDFVVEKVGEALSEAREKDARKLNLLMVNVPENTGEDAQKKDMESVNKLMKKILPDEDVKITNLVRLPIGKGQTNIGTAPRMVKIKVEDVQIKRKILTNANKLNEGSDIRDPKKKLYINQDLTRAERLENKKLREDLKNHPDRENMRIKGKKLVPKEEAEDNGRRGATNERGPPQGE